MSVPNILSIIFLLSVGVNFIKDFAKQTGVLLDPIYTGKMAFACWDLLKKNHFPPGSRILMVHTGGLQGNRGFTQRTGIVLPTPVL